MASKVIDELKLILNGISRNRISGGEAARSAAIGAILSSLAGAGIGALSGEKGRRKKRAVKGAIIGALAGGLGGPVYAQIRKYLDGVPFDNSRFYKATHNKGDKVYIGVAGSANGEGESWFADEMRDRFGNNVVMLRHVDDIGRKYKELKDKGLDVTVVGHSSGGASAGKFLREHPEAKGYLIDPVSWFGRGVPENAVVFTADKSTRHGGPSENTIADIGGRWNYTGDNSVVFKGSHSNRMEHIIRDYVSKGITPKSRSHSIPEYVTSEFGMGKEGDGTRWIDFVDVMDCHMRKQAAIPGVLYNLPQTRYNRAKYLHDKVMSKLPHHTAEEYERVVRLRNYRTPSDPYYYNILVGGANAGGKGIEGLSEMPFGILGVGKNHKTFRHNQAEEIRAEIEKAKKEGLHPRVVGHSWGGGTVANIAKDYPDVPFYAMDPVGWFNRIDETPSNLSIYFPDENPDVSVGFAEKLAPILGGRWPRDIRGKGRIMEYEGHHVAGLNGVINYINKAEMNKRNDGIQN